MRVSSRFGKNVLAWVAIPAALLALPVLAHSSELSMLDTLERGAWDLRIRDDGSHQRICVSNGSEFIQIRHRQPGCSQFVVRDLTGLVTVQYTCPGNGYGRTTIRREGPKLVQIESQGIINGVPFAFKGEGRYTGSC